MVSSELTSGAIDELVGSLISIAADVRIVVEEMHPDSRREKTRGRFINQYELDVAADKVIHERLSSVISDDVYVLSEEREIDREKLESSPTIIVVDPVDGSTNAAYGFDYWCFSAAIVSNGRVVAGVVVDQVTGRIFTATQHEGAYISHATGEKQVLNANDFRQHDVGTRADNFSQALIDYHSHDGPPIPLTHLRHGGASALAIVDVARGALDAYIDDEEILLKPWDLLAAEYIALQSGAKVLRRDSAGIFAATGVLVTRSEALLEDFSTLFPSFFV